MAEGRDGKKLGSWRWVDQLWSWPTRLLMKYMSILFKPVESGYFLPAAKGILTDTQEEERKRPIPLCPQDGKLATNLCLSLDWTLVLLYFLQEVPLFLISIERRALYRVFNRFRLESEYFRITRDFFTQGSKRVNDFSRITYQVRGRSGMGARLLETSLKNSFTISLSLSPPVQLLLQGLKCRGSVLVMVWTLPERWPSWPCFLPCAYESSPCQAPGLAMSGMMTYNCRQEVIFSFSCCQPHQPWLSPFPSTSSCQSMLEIIKMAMSPSLEIRPQRVSLHSSPICSSFQTIMSHLASQHAPEWEKFPQQESEVCSCTGLSGRCSGTEVTGSIMFWGYSPREAAWQSWDWKSEGPR